MQCVNMNTYWDRPLSLNDIDAVRGLELEQIWILRCLLPGELKHNGAYA